MKFVFYTYTMDNIGSEIQAQRNRRTKLMKSDEINKFARLRLARRSVPQIDKVYYTIALK